MHPFEELRNFFLHRIDEDLFYSAACCNVKMNQKLDTTLDRNTYDKLLAVKIFLVEMNRDCRIELNSTLSTNHFQGLLHFFLEGIDEELIYLSNVCNAKMNQQMDTTYDKRIYAKLFAVRIFLDDKRRRSETNNSRSLKRSRED